MKFTVINADTTDAAFRVHKIGCSDIKKEVKAYQAELWEATGVTAQDAVKTAVDEFHAEDQNYQIADFYIAPCCK